MQALLKMPIRHKYKNQPSITSCGGLRPRLRRDLDHVSVSKESPKPSQKRPQNPSKIDPKTGPNRSFIAAPFFDPFLVRKNAPKDPQREPREHPRPYTNLSKIDLEMDTKTERESFMIFINFGPQNRWVWGTFLKTNSFPTWRPSFSKNRAPASTGAQFLRFRAFKKSIKNVQKTMLNTKLKNDAKKVRF